MAKSTNKELVELLKSRNFDNRYDNLISDAENNKFHDFKSDVGTPKLLLSSELAAFPELMDIRRSVWQGDFDESLFDEEEDKTDKGDINDYDEK